MLKDRRLLSGFVVSALGFVLSFILDRYDLSADLSGLEDMVLMVSEGMEILGLIIISVSKKFVESVKAEKSGSSK